jgi:hypothetical protein
MTDDVDLVGRRVGAMHLAYDCLGCANTVAVSITDGKDSNGHRCLVQRPRDCPTCGEGISITLVSELLPSERTAR